jgi:hypothetical protein
MRRYKFQALVHLAPAEAGAASAELPPGMTRYLVVRGQHRENHTSKIFSAMVSRDGDVVPQPAAPSTVTMVVVGDDVPQYLEPGDHFALWAGSDIGEGVVSRRLFI